jgi:dolichol-phosphate mannosyltransferase
LKTESRERERERDREREKIKNNLMMEPTLIFLPTYNESENLERVVREILAQGEQVEVLVVDDLSPDGTGEIADTLAAANPRVHVLHRPGPRGRGLAGLDGYRWGLAHPKYAWIGEMDADGSHDASYLSAIFAATPDADMVVCSRLVPGGGERGRPFWRRAVTLAANAYIRRALGLKVRDCTTGYRVMRREALAAIPLDRAACAGPAIVQEILFLFARAGFRIREIPFVFGERAAGESKLNWRTLLRSLRDVREIRRRFRAV